VFILPFAVYATRIRINMSKAQVTLVPLKEEDREQFVNSPRLSAMHYRRGFQGTCGAKDFRLNIDTVNTQLKQYRACSTRYY